ncbi:hypothetical protein [Pseudomonas sp. Ant30-3]|uniref:hypothetical protein n=1 Tax=Pseudomonas sp. Ant30-3 TaxID=1488328 RepID=UPI000490D5D7|nr:hypothetical protein [Pseudomonas sp. Ant30-3]
MLGIDDDDDDDDDDETKRDDDCWAAGRRLRQLLQGFAGVTCAARSAIRPPRQAVAVSAPSGG